MTTMIKGLKNYFLGKDLNEVQAYQDATMRELELEAPKKNRERLFYSTIPSIISAGGIVTTLITMNPNYLALVPAGETIRLLARRKVKNKQKELEELTSDVLIGLKVLEEQEKRQ